MTTGKVFHTKAHKRQKNEKYYTPARPVQVVLRYLSFKTPPFFPLVWECAAGAGNISELLAERGFEVFASDIDPDKPSIAPINFLTQRVAPEGCRVILTNPPFGTGGRLAYQFCWHALRLMEPVGGMVVMLMRDDYDSAGGRLELFDRHPAFDKKIVLSERVRWTNLPQKKDAGPSGSHAWFVWDWSRAPGPATLHYGGKK